MVICRDLDRWPESRFIGREYKVTSEFRGPIILCGGLQKKCSKLICRDLQCTTHAERSNIEFRCYSIRQSIRTRIEDQG